MLMRRVRECFRLGAGRGVCAFKIAFLGYFFCISSVSFADLSGSDVLVLVNANSPTSKYIAKMYRQYHPDVPESQVLVLTDREGLVLRDCSGQLSTAADEILTRQEYNELIATPVRDYLLTNNFVTQIKVIVTTAGMPYRIADTVLGDVVFPAGSNPFAVSTNLGTVDAASVESELTCLWHSDHGSVPFGIQGRMVNPYQGYRFSPVDMFLRLMPSAKTMKWGYANSVTGQPPKMEGDLPMSWPPSFGTVNRSFNAGDIYLTCRLDGPKDIGQSAVFAVREMLERAKRASDPQNGVNPLKAVAVFDDSPNSSLDQNRVYNLDGSTNYCIYNSEFKQPADAPTILILDDYVAGYTSLTSSESINYNGLNSGLASSALGP